MGGNSTAPWVGPGLAERLKKEAATNEREPEKKEKKKKSERAMEWLRRNR
jgi:hypothetical protein